ncbi:MAG: YkvA family protein [Bacteroidota bacterium]
MSSGKKISDSAKEAIGDRSKLSKVLSDSSKKLKKLAQESSEWKELRSKTNILIRMVQVHLSGEYSAFSRSSLFLIVFALIYFITPTDVIPDFVPALGFTDDASILFLIYKKLNKDIEAFLKWSGGEEEKP